MMSPAVQVALALTLPGLLFLGLLVSHIEAVRLRVRSR